MIGAEDLKAWDKENTAMVLLFFLLVFTVYGLSNNYYSLLVLLPAIFFFFKSNNDYFWLAFFTLIFIHPIGLFSEATQGAIHRLPLFTIAGGLSFSTNDMLIILIVVKASFFSKMRYNVFRKDLLRILIYAVFLVLVAVIIHDTSFGIMANQVRAFFYFFLILGYNNLLVDDKQVFKMLLLIMPFIFLHLVDALYFFSTGDYLMSLISINPNLRYDSYGLLTEMGYTGRYLSHSFILIMLPLVGSLLLATFHRSKTYFILIAIISYLIILFSATRSWSVIGGIIILSYLFRFISFSRLKYLLIALALLIPGGYFVSRSDIGDNVSASFKRIESIATIGQEESLATKSIQHKTETTLKEDLANIKKNPITGWAFSDTQGRGDAGNFGLIAEVGFVGFFLFLIFWVNITILLKWGMKQNFIPAHYRDMLFVLFVVFIGLLISHFTTNRIFGLMLFPVFMSFFFVLINKIWLAAYDYYHE